MKKKYLGLLCLMFIIAAFVAGCKEYSIEGIAYTLGRESSIEFTDEKGVWNYSVKGARQILSLDGIEMVVIERNLAHVQAGDKEFAVQLDNNNRPSAVTVPWGVEIGASEYTLAAHALEFCRLGAEVHSGTPWGAIIIMIIFAAGGVLLVIYAHKLVKPGDFDPSGRRDNRLLTLRIVGCVLAIVSILVLLIVIFA